MYVSTEGVTVGLSTKKKQQNRDAARPVSPEAPRPEVVAKTGARVGIEIDGPTVHVVTISAHGVVTLRTFEGDTTAAALESALKHVPRGDIDRVAWTGGRQNLRRLDVPNVPTRAMKAAITTIAEESLPIVPGATSIAALDLGLSDPLDPAVGRSMIIAAIESEDLDPVWRRLGGRRAPLTASAFLVGKDGLYLHAAYSTAELILVRDGAPIAVRSMRTGGVSTLLSSINESSDTPVHGLDGLAYAVSAPFNGDGSAIDTYLEALVEDVRRTVVFWRREGLHVEDTIHVIGAGAALPTLNQRLREASYVPAAPALPNNLDVSGLNDIERTVAFPALMAAIRDLDDQPYALLPNPVFEEKKARDKAKARRTRMVFAALVAVGIAVAVIVVPWLGVQAQMAKANYDRNNAADAAKAVADELRLETKVKSGESTIKKARATQPPWAAVIQRIRSTTPNATSMVVINDIKLSVTEGVLTGQFKASAASTSGQAFDNGAISEWLIALKGAGIDAVPGSFETEDGVTSTTFTFTAPVDAFSGEDGGEG